jgi:hypothetical protein
MKATPPLTKTVLLQHIEPKCEFVNKQSMARGISLYNECIRIALITMNYDSSRVAHFE